MPSTGWAATASRTLVLRRHGADRLDAELVIESELPEAAGRVGVSHDRVTLTADDSRLEHAGSLLAPLLFAAICPRFSGSLSPIRRSPTAACSTAPSRSWSTPPRATAPTSPACAS